MECREMQLRLSGNFFVVDDLKEIRQVRKKETSIYCSAHLCHSLIAPCMCPDQGSKLQRWHMGEDAPTNWTTWPGTSGDILLFSVNRIETIFRLKLRK